MFRKISSISSKIWGGALIRAEALITANTVYRSSHSYTCLYVVYIPLLTYGSTQTINILLRLHQVKFYILKVKELYSNQCFLSLKMFWQFYTISRDLVSEMSWKFCISVLTVIYEQKVNIYAETEHSKYILSASSQVMFSFYWGGMTSWGSFWYLRKASFNISLTFFLTRNFFCFEQL